jgi:hypothetical protein
MHKAIFTQYHPISLFSYQRPGPAFQECLGGCWLSLVNDRPGLCSGAESLVQLSTNLKVEDLGRNHSYTFQYI